MDGLFYKNVDIYDLPSILENGLLSMDESGNNDTLKLFAETAPVWTQIDGYFRGIYNDGSGVFDLYNVRYQIPE